MRSPFVELLADLAAALTDLGVEWDLFGAQAAALYGSPRFSPAGRKISRLSRASSRPAPTTWNPRLSATRSRCSNRRSIEATYSLRSTRRSRDAENVIRTKQHRSRALARPMAFAIPWRHPSRRGTHHSEHALWALGHAPCGIPFRCLVFMPRVSRHGVRRHGGRSIITESVIAIPSTSRCSARSACVSPVVGRADA